VSELLKLNRLVINQKAKIIEVNQEFKILDEDGNQVGAIRQEGQSALKKVLRVVSDVDKFFTHTLVVFDAAGNKVVELTRPRKVFKSKLLVKDGTGRDVGQIVQQNVFGKIRFGLETADGKKVGEIRAENWRAWDFALVDEADHEIGRITKKWEGLAKNIFTTADNYVLEIDAGVQGDLRLIALASAAGVDTALKQDSRGLS
jgi:uncharacterized protein YxjI